MARYFLNILKYMAKFANPLIEQGLCKVFFASLARPKMLGNNLNSLPDEIEQLTELRSLFLYANSFRNFRSHPDFISSGLLKPSVIRLDHLIALRQSMICRELGSLSTDTQRAILNRLYQTLKM